MVDVRQWNSVRDVDAAFVFFFEDDVRWLLVDSDAKAFEFSLNDSFFRQRLVHVQDDEDEMASLRDRNDLTTPTFAILGSLDDTRQIEHLNGSTIILNLAGNGGQRGKLVRSNYVASVSIESLALHQAQPSECCPVNLLMSVLFPTDGNPMNPTLATPVLATSKPATNNQAIIRISRDCICLQPPPPPLDDGVNSSLRNLASFAFSWPK